MPMTIEIKDGKHRGELGVVIEEMSDGRLKTLTLEGDIHYYDKEGKEYTNYRGFTETMFINPERD